MEEEKPEVDGPSVHFHDMELDDRILKAIAKLGWSEPTLVQEKAIPLSLEGKDVLMRGRTGSGKTAAFLIPIIQKILNWKRESSDQLIRALVLAPSKELCAQIHRNVVSLTTKCSREVRAVDISPQTAVQNQRPLLADCPDIVIATPTRAVLHITSGSLSLENMKMLVVDEADLMFSHGYEKDVNQIISHLPKIYQATLASATLTDEVISLKKILLHNAVTLKLKESELAPIHQLTHLKLYAQANDKPAFLYALLKLGLVKGKTIIFVNTVDKCYRLKLFLQQVDILCCVLNSELPATVRCHVVTQFNDGKYQIIIASDEAMLDNPTKTPSRRHKDVESNISRGVDFQEVSNIINFDCPLSINSYVHRAGRTARGNNKGTVLSFVTASETPMMDAVDDHLKQGLGCGDTIFKVYPLKESEIAGFRYRANDAWRATTRVIIKEARLKEIKREMFNCAKLKNFFNEHPRDLDTLRHDKPISKLKLPPHLANVPEYLVPPALKGVPGLVKVKKAKKHFKPNNKGNLRHKAKRKNVLSAMDFSEVEAELSSKKKKKIH